MCYLECSYVGIVIVIVPNDEVNVAATELHHLSKCMSTMKIVRQEEFFTQGIQEKIIFKILCRMVSYKCHDFFFAEYINKICMM